MNEEEAKTNKTKIIHRDGSYKLFSRILASIQVFVYQGAVFFAQMTLANQFFIPNTTGGYDIGSLQGNRMTWLMIETACFYMYMFAAVVYILTRQL